MSELHTPAGRRLDSWKEIADHLGCDVRTAMRWEQEAGLPVHRVPGGRRRVVLAFVDELEQWDRTRTRKDAEPEPLRPVPQRIRLLPLWAALLMLLLSAAAVVFGIAHRHSPDGTPEEVVFSLSSATFRFAKYTMSIPDGGNGVLLAHDLNGDGLPEIVAGGAPAGKLAILWNKGAGNFSAPVYLSGCRDSVTPAAGDFDSDGNTDLAVACFGTSQVEVWWGDGKGNFGVPARVSVGPGPMRLESANFSKQGVNAITAGNDVGPLMIVTGRQDRSFTTQRLDVERPFTTAIGDFNGDGHNDLAVLCAVTCHAVHVFLNRGDGTFSKPAAMDVAAAPWQLVTDDLNQDGSLDLIVTSANGDTQTLLGNGDGTFQPARLLRSMNAPLLFPFMQGEEKYILSIESWRGEIQLWHVSHDLQVELSGKVILAKNLRSAAIADLNGDGLTDFAFNFLKEGRPSLVVMLQKQNG